MADGTARLRPQPQRVLHCTACHHCNAPCAPGLAFLHQLGAALAVAPLDPGFEIAGSASLRCGARVCPVVWRATATGAWLWGDVEASVPIAQLMIGAAQRPPGPGPLAPAAEIVTGVVAVQ